MGQKTQNFGVQRFMIEENKIFRYEMLVLTGRVIQDTRISGNEKIFYSIIINLSRKSGYCFASNLALSNTMKSIICKCDIRQVKNYLRKLKELKYIKVVVEGNKRYIYPLDNKIQDIPNEKIWDYDWLNKEEN